MKTGQEDAIPSLLPKVPCSQWTGMICICISRLISEWNKERCCKSTLSPACTSCLSPPFHWIKCQSTCCCRHHTFLIPMSWDALPSKLNHQVTFSWFSHKKDIWQKSEKERMVLVGDQSTVLMQTLFSGSTSFSLAVHLWWPVEKHLILRNASDGKIEGTSWNKPFVNMLFAQNNFFCHKQHVPDTSAAKLSYTTARHPLMQALQEYCHTQLSSGCTHYAAPASVHNSSQTTELYDCQDLSSAISS